MMVGKAARKRTKLLRESLYKALSAEVNPEFATILKVMGALDLKITVRSGKLFHYARS
jgi:probable addiction module antidote protein